MILIIVYFMISFFSGLLKHSNMCISTLFLWHRSTHMELKCKEWFSAPLLHLVRSISSQIIVRNWFESFIVCLLFYFCVRLGHFDNFTLLNIHNYFWRSEQIKVFVSIFEVRLTPFVLKFSQLGRNLSSLRDESLGYKSRRR